MQACEVVGKVSCDAHSFKVTPMEWHEVIVITDGGLTNAPKRTFVVISRLGMGTIVTEVLHALSTLAQAEPEATAQFLTLIPTYQDTVGICFHSLCPL
ncbi:unnamed protein product [Hydatigera taeniaeformis]|uniref:Protein-serine/threonine phosphatase n=1 Tax=Hydatigena taeniaeformis TaxID=6205 RepID=A0A0R3WPU4_HYDTA|nr:unnamed protein product [Hydatigera taeniaeformis]